MNTPHTPVGETLTNGNWHLHAPDLEGRSYDYRLTASGVTIAFVCGDIPQAPAIAKLLLSAPTLLKERDDLRAALEEIAGMADTGRETVSEIVGSRIGSGGQPSRQIDSAAAATRGSFMAIADLAKATLSKHSLGIIGATIIEHQDKFTKA